jgi:hypothetical protein
MVPPVQPIAFNIADAAKSSKYPRHGWAENSDGFHLLWLPFVGILRNVTDVRRAKGLTADLSSGDIHAIDAFYACLSNLVVALREMAQVEREDGTFLIDNNDELTKRYRTEELYILYLESVFTHLRRLADRFAAASRVILFSNPGTASTEFKKLKKAVFDANSLARMKPTVNLAALQAAFRDHTRWFDDLRNSHTREGIRDQMEHRSVRLLIGRQRANEGPVVRTAYLARSSGDIDMERELSKLLRLFLLDLCEFLTGVHTAVGFGEAYERLDNFLVFGVDADVVHWWPCL